MATDQTSKGGWRERRREKKREKARRTGDTPEKIAEGHKLNDPTPGENATKAGLGGTAAASAGF
jgi:hypothetical protein